MRTLGDSLINADAVRRAPDNHPHVVLCSTNGRWPFAAYTEGDSLDDFLDHAMLDLMTCCGERRAAIPKLPANCELTALHFINAWSSSKALSFDCQRGRGQHCLAYWAVWFRTARHLLLIRLFQQGTRCRG